MEQTQKFNLKHVFLFTSLIIGSLAGTISSSYAEKVYLKMWGPCMKPNDKRGHTSTIQLSKEACDKACLEKKQKGELIGDNSGQCVGRNQFKVDTCNCETKWSLKSIGSLLFFPDYRLSFFKRTSNGSSPSDRRLWKFLLLPFLWSARCWYAFRRSRKRARTRDSLLHRFFNARCSAFELVLVDRP